MTPCALGAHQGRWAALVAPSVWFPSILIASAFLTLGAPLFADALPPVRLQVKEVAQDSFEVQWSVPKVISPQTMPSPRLPAHCEAEGARTFLDQPSAWLTRQLFRCRGGLSGHPLGIDFPVFNVNLGTVLRLELLTGERYAHMLNPGESTWMVPVRETGGLANALTEASAAARRGVVHFGTGWAHLAFLVAVCLVGGLQRRLALATAFLLAQVASVLGASVLGLELDLPLAEIGVAVAAALLAREALRPEEERRQLTALAAAAGAVHGLGVSQIGAATGEAASLWSLLLMVLGMDAALLIGSAVFGVVAGLLPSRWARPPVVSRLTYVVGGVAVAAALAAVVSGPVLASRDRELELPSLVSSFDGSQAAGRLVSNVPDVPLQSYVAVEAFEVRLEVLVRPRLTAGMLGLGREAEIAVEVQDEVKKRALELVAEHGALEIDGVARRADAQRVDFLTFDAQGALPRSAPVPELLEEAWIGVSSVYFTPQPAQELRLDWKRFDVAPEAPATVTDPESTLTVSLSPGEPALVWQNQLVEDPVPTVEAIAVEPVELPVPVASLALLLVGALVATRVARRGSGALAGGLARVLVVVVILLGPFAQVAVALPAQWSRVPEEGQAKRILAGLLGNMYRAFEFREESVVYDRLALSVTGDTLAQVYLDHRRTLEMEERGGARARVEAIEVLEVEDVEAAPSGGFSCEASWTIAGTVTHFGHRHFRQNRFDARMLVVADGPVWKIQSVEVLGEERLR